MLAIYVLFLIISGVAILVMTGMNKGRTRMRRVWSALIGVGFLGYAFYLLFFFQGGEVTFFLYVFILPVLMAVQFFRSRGVNRATGASQAPIPGYGQQPPFGQQPGYGQQGGFAQQADSGQGVNGQQAGNGQSAGGQSQWGSIQ